MEFKKNVYVVFTEYQFLQALNIATAIYDSDEFINSIYLVRNGSRLNGFKSNINSEINNIIIHVLDLKNQKEIAGFILNENPTHFLFFQAISGLNVYLAHTFYKRGVEISLGPDGYNAYADFKKKHHSMSILKDSFKENLKLIKDKMFSGKIHRFDYYTYGYQRFINNLWLTHPNQYKHQSKNKVQLLQLPEFNKKCINIIKNSFDFNIEFPKNDVIYFFNQPLWSGLVDIEFDFLKEVVASFSDKKIVVKFHPLTDKTMKEKYKTLKGLLVIESSIPAEVFILNLDNCIVFSGWSSVLLTENKSCNYYFNFPIYKKLNDPIFNQINIIPLDHIKIIESPKEMKFPNV
jgi:hypothetical protein